MKLQMRTLAAAGMVVLMLCSAGAAIGASMVLNEYNAVKTTAYLTKGDGTYGSDTYFGTILGNGGDWMEFVVVQDYLDIRGWYVTTTQDGATDATIEIPYLDVFGSLRSGTILTIAENVATDLSYAPAYDPGNPYAGDWWINYQASFSAGDNTHKNFQVTTYDTSDNVVYGPAGEGIVREDGVTVGIGSDEIFKLEATPTSLTAPNSAAYNDGTSSSFGSQNIFSGGMVVQDLSPLRDCMVPEPGSILALGAGLAGLVGFARRRK